MKGPGSPLPLLRSATVVFDEVHLVVEDTHGEGRRAESFRLTPVLLRQPSLIVAVVMGALFALIGSQGLNTLLGLPRLESVFSMPAAALAVLFTALGVALGSLIGALISAEPLVPQRWQERSADDPYLGR